MKKEMALLFSFSVLVCLSVMPAHAQSKGSGKNQGPSVNSNHVAGSSHDQGKTNWDTKLNTRMQSDPALAKRVQDLLPKGTTLATAENGFKNEGQFIAALHVSQNLDIPFDQLKAKMTGSNPESLGKSIHDLKPSLSEDQVDNEAKKAEQQAKKTEKG